MMNQNENQKNVVVKKDLIVKNIPINYKIEIENHRDNGEVDDDGPL